MNFISSILYKLFLSPVLGLFIRHVVFSAPGGALIWEGVPLIFDTATRQEGIVKLAAGIGALFTGVGSSLKQKSLAKQAKEATLVEGRIVKEDEF